MKAMIFAAGLGTRLKPLTENIPKALVEINGTPILEIVIKKLIQSGFDEIIINVHYFAEKVISFLQSKNYFGIRIEISDESGQLLETGGGLKKAAWFFDDGSPFLLQNVDILSTVNLSKLYDQHIKEKNLATLCIEDRDSSRKLQFNKAGFLCGWINKKTNERKISRLDVPEFEFAFNGIHVINPSIFGLIEENGAFSIIDLYLRLAKYHDIGYYSEPFAKFLDIGTPETYSKAQNF